MVSSVSRGSWSSTVRATSESVQEDAFVNEEGKQCPHQLREGTTLVAIIGGLVAIGHLPAAGFGVAIVRCPTTV
jgi:hypothetical protein